MTSLYDISCFLWRQNDIIIYKTDKK